ncbi:aminotransferase class I/II-fold pyridoxal phosphate-dependent enzyme [Alteribacter natronophilus]|uniref:aminotransferase class I/II-fold pyridoxal phosphate-dependent enzyme n=1 Tax=Alteribacter natronophilus TaxID=2583810 RepID=UPI00110E6B42|nr:aminotransferase class I/II-fold pyridoxal phosphate-dependent enzyme [Alteribacter natronophilus]TMW69978.1 aminotransferase class V-fold PLP-dependent enzyme [Alteribacter natronophilus]
MNQNRMPVVEALKKHAMSGSVSMHVPGHKNGSVFHSGSREIFSGVLSIDLTEISGMDDLHCPEGIIRDAEMLAAGLYGTKMTSFLVGGSTAGNLAAILGTVKEGDCVLVQRNSHQSVIHGLEMAGAAPVLLEPEQSENRTYGVSVNTVREAVAAWPQARALLLTSPTYEGYVQDLTDHIAAAHEAGIPVIVDEAHGAHLIIEEQGWPLTALRAGADAVVQSAHKMLPAMTMSSLLHMQGERLDHEKIRKYLRMIQSSSPSYPLMASLDSARAYLASYTPEEGRAMLEWSREFRSLLNRIPQISCAPSVINNYIQDPLKIVVESMCRASGSELQKAFAEEGIIPELAGPSHVLFTLPLAKEKPDFKGVAEAVQRACSQYNAAAYKNGPERYEPSFSGGGERIIPLAMTYREMASYSAEKVPYTKAAGKIAAEDVVPYPPGIPLLVKGERITAERVGKLSELVSTGASFQSGGAFKTEGISVFQHLP